ncbi:MAG: YraN family protein [Alphaproteobacteria bacterium]|jgi:putative endonuclease|nr:YraN family protein [Alphaproteobacteria bacterium]
MRFKNTYRAGLFAEFLARIYLRIRGFKILKSRYITGRYTKRAEIDIIARRGNLVIFVEVKNRLNVRTAFDAISHKQASRLRRAAETWIKKNRWYGNARFDVIVVSGWRVQWFKNAL